MSAVWTFLLVAFLILMLVVAIQVGPWYIAAYLGVVMAIGLYRGILG